LTLWTAAPTGTRVPWKKKCRRGQARRAKNKENKRGNAAQTTAFGYLRKAKSV